MTTSQIVIFCILVSGTLIGYVGTMLSKTELDKLGYGFLQMFCTALIIVIAIVMTEEREKALLESKGICPEYELINNVYKLKEK